MAFGAPDIQALIDAGEGYAAEVLGEPFEWFRPIGPRRPLAPEFRMGRLLARMDPDPKFGAKRPAGYGKPLWAALLDRSRTRVGDYLRGASGTFFLIARQPLLPTLAVECNAIVTLSRPGGIDMAHEDDYGGRTAPTDRPLLDGWPASVLAGGRGQASAAGLPADTAMKGKEMLLPPTPGVELRVGDICEVRGADPDLPGEGERLTLASVELSDLGWRATGIMSEV